MYIRNIMGDLRPKIPTRRFQETLRSRQARICPRLTHMTARHLPTPKLTAYQPSGSSNLTQAASELSYNRSLADAGVPDLGSLPTYLT